MLVATLDNVRPWPTCRGDEQPIDATTRALDAVQLGLAELCMPWDDAPRTAFKRLVVWAPNVLAAVAEKCVDGRHHSSPQQIVHLPLR